MWYNYNESELGLQSSTINLYSTRLSYDLIKLNVPCSITAMEERNGGMMLA